MMIKVPLKWRNWKYKLTFSSQGEDLDDVEEQKSKTFTKVEEKGKRPLDQDIA